MLHVDSDQRWWMSPGGQGRTSVTQKHAVVDVGRQCSLTHGAIVIKRAGAAPSAPWGALQSPPGGQAGVIVV